MTAPPIVSAMPSEPEMPARERIPLYCEAPGQPGRSLYGRESVLEREDSCCRRSGYRPSGASADELFELGMRELREGHRDAAYADFLACYRTGQQLAIASANGSCTTSSATWPRCTPTACSRSRHSSRRQPTTRRPNPGVKLRRTSTLPINSGPSNSRSCGPKCSMLTSRPSGSRTAIRPRRSSTSTKRLPASINRTSARRPSLRS